VQVEELRAINDEQVLSIEDYEAQRQVRYTASASSMQCVHADANNSKACRASLALQEATLMFRPCGREWADVSPAAD
jgi:hypothetical protein